MKKALVFFVAFVFVMQCFCPLTVTAYDVHGLNYNSNKVMINLNYGYGSDKINGLQELESYAAMLKSAIGSTEPVVNNGINLFGVDITYASKIVSSFSVTLKRQEKQYCLPQIDFLSITMGDAIYSIYPNYINTVPEVKLPEAVRVNVAGEVLYYTVPDSEADNVLRPLSQVDCAGRMFCGVVLKEVSVIADYSSTVEGESLTLYSIKLERNDAVSPLAELLNSSAFEGSRSAALHTLLGCSAVQSHYFDGYASQPEVTEPEATLTVGVGHGDASFARIEALSRSANGGAVAGVELAEVEKITAKATDGATDGYSVYSVKLGAGVDTESAISALTEAGLDAYACSYETQSDYTTAVLAGDVNGDGEVNSIDAALALKHTAGAESFTAAQKAAGDFNGDGTVNSIDAAMVLKTSAGL